MSNQSKHTPGPWFIGDLSDEIFAKGHTPSTIGICAKTDDSTNEQWQANARLIAAAPKLLEALQSFISRTQGLLDGEPDTQYLWDKLGPEYRQALAIIAEVDA